MALKILLADDSMTAQNMARKILSDAGYEVVTVSNGAAALKKIAEITPDLVILDIYMPGYSGFEVCDRVKRASENAPVLLSVGKLEPYREEDAVAVHADGVIIKPFEATELLATVKAVLQGSPERTRAVVQLPASLPDGGLEGSSTEPFDVHPIEDQLPPSARRADAPVAASDVAFAAAFPASVATQTSLDRGLPAEVSRLTEGLGGPPPAVPPQDATPGLPASPIAGLLQDPGSAVPSETPVAVVGAATAYPAAAKSVDFGIDHFLPEQLHGHSVAPAVAERAADPGSPANAFAFAGVVEPVSELAPDPPFGFEPAVPVVQAETSQPEQEQHLPVIPESAPAAPAAGSSFAEVDLAQTPLTSVPLTDAQPAGAGTKWRIEVRSVSPQSSTAGQPLTEDNDFSIEFVPESEPLSSAEADHGLAAFAGTAESSPPLADPLMYSMSVPPVPSAGTPPMVIDDLEFLSSAPPLIASEPATGPAGSDAPSVAGGVSFSVPKMLEATAAMALPDLLGAHSTASIPVERITGLPADAGVAREMRPSPAAAASARPSRREAEHPGTLDSAAVSDVVQRAIERYKPLIIAEIVRELSKPRG